MFTVYVALYIMYMSFSSSMYFISYLHIVCISFCLLCMYPTVYWLVVWCSGNALCQINEVILQRVRLVLGWVTVFGQVNHLGMKPASHVNSAICPLWVGVMSIDQLLGWVVISGDGECSTTAASFGGSEAQADCLGPNVSGCLALVLHSSNEPSELLQCTMMTAP